MASPVEYILDIDPATLEYVSGWERIKISIMTILQTRLRTRLMREWFGSNFLDIQDKPLCQEVWMDSIIAASEAVNKFEPEFQITSITILRADSNGELEARITGVDLVEQKNKYLRTTFSLA